MNVFTRALHRQGDRLAGRGEDVHDGMEVTFSDVLDPKSVEADNIAAEQFNVVRTGNDGSPEFSVKEPKKVGHDVVEIKSAKLQPDGKTIALDIPGLTPVTNFNLTFKLTAADGSPVEKSWIIRSIECRN